MLNSIVIWYKRQKRAILAAYETYHLYATDMPKLVCEHLDSCNVREYESDNSRFMKEWYNTTQMKIAIENRKMGNENDQV